jgi:hypothetical protein
MKNKPSNNSIDFIGIGAQKAGTTWLYARLMELPDFSLPPIKELHYFDRSKEYPSPNKLSETKLINRLRSYHWVKSSTKRLFKEIREKKINNFKWLLKWYFSNFNDQWYLSLFNSLNGIKGEISPSYSILKENDIIEMHKITSDSKLIFLLRNPVERAWSHFKFNMRKDPNFDIEMVDSKHIIEFINSEGQESRSNYIRTIEEYSKHYAKSNILICFFDAIKDNPLQLLSEIVSFVGGDASIISSTCNLKEKTNLSKKIKIPDEVEIFLKEKYYLLIKKMSEDYGSYCLKWYTDLYLEKVKKSKKKKEILSPTIKLFNNATKVG